jgi:hypothetical protein
MPLGRGKYDKGDREKMGNVIEKGIKRKYNGKKKLKG